MVSASSSRDERGPCGERLVRAEIVFSVENLRVASAAEPGTEEGVAIIANLRLHTSLPDGSERPNGRWQIRFDYVVPDASVREQLRRIADAGMTDLGPVVGDLRRDSFDIDKGLLEALPREYVVTPDLQKCVDRWEASPQQP